MINSMNSAVLDNDQVSEDTLLEGRVRIRQPREGYRAAIDPVLLAAAVPAKPKQKVLDAGAGVGTVSLCLAARVSGVAITAIEKNPILAALAAENAALNSVKFDVVEGDITALPKEITPGTFDHVMANPPYLPETHGHPSPHDIKRAATREAEVGIEGWVTCAHTALKHKGTFTLIHRADRLDTILVVLSQGFGDIGVFPLWPKSADNAGAALDAKRVIIRARKGVSSPLRLLPGLILHEADGAYTPAAEQILRGGAEITI
jgi:tRNA1(Val) A37 N6-methylase TrmN6